MFTFLDLLTFVASLIEIESLNFMSINGQVIPSASPLVRGFELIYLRVGLMLSWLPGQCLVHSEFQVSVCLSEDLFMC